MRPDAGPDMHVVTATPLPSAPVPEGHTIHRLALDQWRDLGGEALAVTSPQGRMGDDAARLDGQQLRRIDAHGKHLFYRFGSATPSRATTLHVHLGLFGTFRCQPSPPAAPKATVRLRMTGAEWSVDLVGPTDCRITDADQERTILERLGPDPLRADADPEAAWTRLQRRRIPIGEALLDQRIIAGVGNVYRAEALYVHRIHPNRPANTITRYEFDGLWATLGAMLRQGVKDRRIITLDGDDLRAFGVPRSRIASKEAVYVYKKDRCLRCETPIDRWDMSGRWAYACATCQVL